MNLLHHPPSDSAEPFMVALRQIDSLVSRSISNSEHRTLSSPCAVGKKRLPGLHTNERLEPLALTENTRRSSLSLSQFAGRK